MNTPGQPPPSLPAQPPNDPLAIPSLICGILSLVCLGPISGIVAIVCGHISHSRIGKSAGALGGKGMALTGLILGYASFALTAFVAVMMAMMMPAIAAVKTNAQRMEAKNTAMQIIAATNQYSTEYDRLPLTTAKGSDFPISNGAFFDVLRAIDKRENPREIVFFETTSTRLRGSVLVDPWGQPYRIVVDADGDGQIKFGNNTVSAPVAIWSAGKNGKDENGDGDDVTSWK